MEAYTDAEGRTATFAEQFVALLDTIGDLAASPVRVLDVGAGIARIPIEICRRRPRVFITAVDRSAALIARARRRIESERLTDRICFAQAQAEALPCRAGEFDAVISNSLIHHLCDPVQALREMVRVLKPGGLLFVRDTLPQPDYERIAAVLGRRAATDSSGISIVRPTVLPGSLNVNQARQLAQSAGLPLDWVAAASPRHWTIAGV